MKVLIAVDGSKCSDAAVEEMAQRPWPKETEIRIISAAEPPSIPTTETWVLPAGYYEQIEKGSEEQARAILASASEKFRDASVRLSAKVVKGYPKDAILEEAEEWGANLIVVGSHGYRGLKRWWLGSVSHAVAMRARCSVEIVRRSEKV